MRRKLKQTTFHQLTALAMGPDILSVWISAHSASQSTPQNILSMTSDSFWLLNVIKSDTNRSVQNILSVKLAIIIWFNACKERTDIWRRFEVAPEETCHGQRHHSHGLSMFFKFHWVAFLPDLHDFTPKTKRNILFIFVHTLHPIYWPDPSAKTLLSHLYLSRWGSHVNHICLPVLRNRTSGQKPSRTGFKKALTESAVTVYWA